MWQISTSGLKKCASFAPAVCTACQCRLLQTNFAVNSRPWRPWIDGKFLYVVRKRLHSGVIRINGAFHTVTPAFPIRIRCKLCYPEEIPPPPNLQSAVSTVKWESLQRICMKKSNAWRRQRTVNHWLRHPQSSSYVTGANWSIHVVEPDITVRLHYVPVFYAKIPWLTISARVRGMPSASSLPVGALSNVLWALLTILHVWRFFAMWFWSARWQW